MPHQPDSHSEVVRDKTPGPSQVGERRFCRGLMSHRAIGELSPLLFVPGCLSDERAAGRSRAQWAYVVSPATSINVSYNTVGAGVEPLQSGSGSRTLIAKSCAVGQFVIKESEFHEREVE